ncbi:SDR family NAD(P)-dependent oxidoreductase [Pirellulaceae bacterium SH501]
MTSEPIRFEQHPGGIVPIRTDGNSSPYVAVVTGSSSGIGRATSLAFAKASAKIVLHGRSNWQGAQQTALEIRNQTGVDCKVIMADVCDESSRHALVDAAFEWFGYVDAWVHCAGADVLTGTARDWSFEQKLQRLWKTDVEANIQLSRQVGARMASQPPRPFAPSMIHIGWDQSSKGFEGDSGQYFCATKAAVEAFSKCLALTLAPRVRVNCVCPGWIQTEWGSQTESGWNERAVGESQLARWGKPEDVADVIVALCSPAFRFVNGQSIPVNGGWKSMFVAPRCTDSSAHRI